MFPPISARPDTEKLPLPRMPAPRADQLLPFQCAMRLAATPPAILKRPPAYTSPPMTTIAFTLLLTPPPIGNHSMPLWRAMLVDWLLGEKLAAAKLPPANTSLPRTAIAETEPGIPLPRADQLVPFQRAMLLADTPPAFVKIPP